MFANLFADRRLRRNAHLLYDQLVTQGREPAFYKPPFDVPDTVDGRFNMILLHLFLVDHWLSASEERMTLRRTLRETMVSDMDRSLREMGVGDMSVGKEMKKIGAALIIQLKSYSDAITSETGEKSLIEAIKRNMEVTEEAARALAEYILKRKQALEKVDVTNWDRPPALFAGNV